MRSRCFVVVGFVRDRGKGPPGRLRADWGLGFGVQDLGFGAQGLSLNFVPLASGYLHSIYIYMYI